MGCTTTDNNAEVLIREIVISFDPELQTSTSNIAGGIRAHCGYYVLPFEHPLPGTELSFHVGADTHTQHGRGGDIPTTPPPWTDAVLCFRGRWIITFSGNPYANAVLS